LIVPESWSWDIASSLREEDGDREILGVFLELVIGGMFVSARITPGVGVDAKKLDGLRRIAATRKVVLEHRAKLLDIGRGVADGNPAIALAFPVRTHVSHSSFEKRSSEGVLLLGDVLVAHEESQDVVVAVECVHNASEAIELVLAPALVGLGELAGSAGRSHDATHGSDVGIKSVQVDEEVDASISECLHAAIMVGIGIDMIHAQGVGAELLHQLDISLALLRVDERILWAELIRDTCIMARLEHAIFQLKSVTSRRCVDRQSKQPNLRSMTHL
jgi:hypothetical protein